MVANALTKIVLDMLENQSTHRSSIKNPTTLSVELANKAYTLEVTESWRTARRLRLRLAAPTFGAAGMSSDSVSESWRWGVSRKPVAACHLRVSCLDRPQSCALLDIGNYTRRLQNVCMIYKS